MSQLTSTEPPLVIRERKISTVTIFFLCAIWVMSLGIYAPLNLASFPTIAVWAKLYSASVSATIVVAEWMVGYLLAALFSFRGSVSGRHLAVGVVVAIVIIPLTRVLQYYILHPVGFYPIYHSPLPPAFIYTPLIVVMTGTTLAAGHALYYQEELRTRELAATRVQNQLALARFHALEAQLKPHFLFNALNSISALVGSSPHLADQALERIELLLRGLLSNSDEAEVPLHKEIETLELFVGLERMRFGERIRFAVHVDSSVADVRVPSLLLQPIVENAVLHGAGVLRGEHFVCVLAQPVGDRLQIIVRDDGPGVAANMIERIGIRNTRLRLAQLYADRHHFSIRNAVSRGCEVTLELPL